MSKCHLHLTLLTHLFEGLDMPTKIGTTFAGAWDQFWPDALPAVINDSYDDTHPANLGSTPRSTLKCQITGKRKQNVDRSRPESAYLSAKLRMTCFAMCCCARLTHTNRPPTRRTRPISSSSLSTWHATSGASCVNNASTVPLSSTTLNSSSANDICDNNTAVDFSTKEVMFSPVYLCLSVSASPLTELLKNYRSHLYKNLVELSGHNTGTKELDLSDLDPRSRSLEVKSKKIICCE